MNIDGRMQGGGSTGQETRMLRTFPTPGGPEPRVVLSLSDFPVRYANNRAPPATEINRWFCCACVRSGYVDPVGMVYDAAASSVCFRTGCRHGRCVNCGLGPTHDIARVARTVGGLFASPGYVDPANWECECGEWARNGLDETSGLGRTFCRNEAGCPFRWRGGILGPGSTVVNRYGTRLGTADQRLVVRGGPWELQRRALGDGRCALWREWRRGGRGGRASSSSRDSSWEGREELRLWREGEAVPEYPYRCPPPGAAMEEAGVYARYERYEKEYLMLMPQRPREQLRAGNMNGARSSEDRSGFFRGSSWSDGRL
ncbi:hypothetical protein QBC34DRAFT_404477 [Podospora aff. communis PSN243]|uniref:Uncharacterized protein n=1 Tax=Podospora aff. communis PSN243 TaxID=3040156 RepID=A0AAV9GQ28_9PEZI|nr:hypothetical protein QBC34DRAFT_404477 [Podospora aff. communis PSN243]